MTYNEPYDQVLLQESQRLARALEDARALLLAIGIEGSLTSPLRQRLIATLNLPDDSPFRVYFHELGKSS